MIYIYMRLLSEGFALLLSLLWEIVVGEAHAWVGGVPDNPGPDHVPRLGVVHGQLVVLVGGIPRGGRGGVPASRGR